MSFHSRVEAGYEAEDSQGTEEDEEVSEAVHTEDEEEGDFKLENLVTFGALQLLIPAEQTIRRRESNSFRHGRR
jgi:hypothetical protein